MLVHALLFHPGVPAVEAQSEVDLVALADLEAVVYVLDESILIIGHVQVLVEGGGLVEEGRVGEHSAWPFLLPAEEGLPGGRVGQTGEPRVHVSDR